MPQPSSNFPNIAEHSRLSGSASTKPRLIVIDDNVRSIGGHYYELANLLMSGAQRWGYQPVLAAHETFQTSSAACLQHRLLPTFRTRRMVRWSLGVDGDSRLPRDIQGRIVGGSILDRAKQAIRDRMEIPSKRPQRMLAQWSDDFCRLMKRIEPTSSDVILVNTGDDFVMLALANALSRLKLASMRIDVIFHFALVDQLSVSHSNSPTLQSIHRQMRTALESLKPHQVALHATTPSLAEQWRKVELRLPVTAIPYPTRQRTIHQSDSSKQPIKAVLAGLPRAEKGREAIHDFLSEIHEPHLRSQRYQLSMQMPAAKWQGLIPLPLHQAYSQSLAGDQNGPLEIMTANLTTDDYHRWLDTADLGLFLYEPERYVARCSGVLLEMLSRGVPVIVPDRCWLAEQVRRAGGHRSIGFIYQNRAEIPDLMQQFTKNRAAMSGRAIAYADKVRAEHSGTNTLRVMGLDNATREFKAA
ncbi:hypothetical protein Pla22_05410 [Rubripirellula amarantea]|uniref:Uncharacterized protein n=2 Tax=Rubripirellula amarantea TaxID=2527999 RepID=A0A5C5WS49_9BACT|nr:hypothetical protein Pla22_05410 [Rubripirellula amarantea]